MVMHIVAKSSTCVAATVTVCTSSTSVALVVRHAAQAQRCAVFARESKASAS